MKEHVIQFGPDRGLVGIITEAPTHTDISLPAVILLNAGMLHRVGPNRLYVKLARVLAQQGYTVLRFDFSGIGDSRPRADHLPYAQSAPAEARAAIDWLAQQRGVHQVVLIGHCAGAMFALLVARDDPRVIGAALMNAEGGDAQWTEIDRLKKESRHKARSYSQGALLSRERWAKFLGGRADYRSIARVVFKDILWYRITELRFRLQQGLTSRSNEVRAQQAAQGQQYLTPLLERGVALLLLHSEGSTGLSHIRATFGETLERAIAAGAVQLVIIPQSDHLFTMVDRQRQVSTTLLGWLHERVKTPLTAVY